MSTRKRSVALLLLAILLVNVALAGTAAAAPRIWVSDADLEQNSTLAGESVGVVLQMHNNGDGGATTVVIKADGSKIKEQRVQVPGDSDVERTIPITFEEPGEYEITVEDKSAGTLEVTRLLVDSTTQRDDGQTARIRAGATEAGESMTANLPDENDHPFTLQRVTMTSSGSPFNRTVATYAPVDGAPFSVPSSENSPVVGAVDMDVLSGVNTTAMRVAVDRHTIRDSGLQSDEITIYRRSDGTFTPLETEQVGTTDDAIVYEATTDGGSQFIVGSLSPDFQIRSTSLETDDADDGQQITLRATVGNDGPVAGDYIAEMRVDGVTVTEQTVSMAPGESQTVALQHTVTKKGEYQIGIGEERVGSIVLTSDSVSSTNQESDGETDATGESSTDESLLDASPSLPSIGNIGALELGVGASIALVGGGLLLVLRR
jgi:hypothetical protein